jgi:hypothetical protein
MHTRSAGARFIRIIAVVAALFLLGCSSSHSSSSSTSSRSFSVSTPEGSASLSLDGQLPSGWPSAFPVPAGATPAGSGSIAGSEQSHMIGVFEASGTGPDTFDFYKDSTELTVKNAKSVGAGSSFVGRMELTGSYSGSVTVTEHNGHTYIVAYLNAATGTGSSAGS